MNNEDKLQSFVTNVDTNEFNSFVKKSKSDFAIKTDVEEVQIDYSWISFFEECLPYIDAIVRNPRKFLIQEEDLTIVEKTKKVTKETIKHLAVNSSLIQDVEEGDVKPKKLLNVYKEDTFDIYENRFFYTLMQRIVLFLEQHLKYIDNDSHISKRRLVKFDAETLQIKENVKLNLELETNSYKFLNIDSTSYKKRMKKINDTIYEFMDTAFVKSLRQASPVRNPIRRTNLLLKDPNFKKCLDLWEFLDKYEAEKIVKINKINDVNKSLDIKQKYLYNYFLNYFALDFESENNLNKHLFEIYLEKSINECLNDLDYSDREYHKLVDRKLKIVRKEQDRKKQEINRCYQIFINENNRNTKTNIELLNN